MMAAAYFRICCPLYLINQVQCGRPVLCYMLLLGWDPEARVFFLPEAEADEATCSTW